MLNTLDALNTLNKPKVSSIIIVRVNKPEDCNLIKSVKQFKPGTFIKFNKFNKFRPVIPELNNVLNSNVGSYFVMTNKTIYPFKKAEHLLSTLNIIANFSYRGSPVAAFSINKDISIASDCYEKLYGLVCPDFNLAYFNDNIEIMASEEYRRDQKVKEELMYAVRSLKIKIDSGYPELYI